MLKEGTRLALLIAVIAIPLTIIFNYEQMKL
jgi:hypothetical protein